jgi:hypothetical protein
MTAWTRNASALAVVALGSLAVVASSSSGSNSGGGNSSPVPGQSATPTGAFADVTVSKCALAANELEGPSATLTVVNHSSKQSNYIITVAFDSPDGKTQLDTGTATVENLNPGQTTSVEAPSLKSDLRNVQFTCKVADVTRLSAVG